MADHPEYAAVLARPKWIVLCLDLDRAAPTPSQVKVLGASYSANSAGLF